MTDDTVEKFSDYRTAMSELRLAQKDSQQVLFDLAQRYREIPPKQRGEVDKLISQWLTSEDENERFDARFLTQEFGLARTAT